MADVAELSQRISDAANEARLHSDSARIAYETSQEFVRLRTQVCNVIKDRLIQIRDYAYATEGRTSPGMIGFEVVQSTSSDGRARVMIPANPDQFLALASRVNQSISTSSDANLVAMSQGLNDQIEIATSHQSRSITLREQWQLELDRRQSSTSILTNLLREVRDLAFAASGPYRYESVSTTGLVVQGSATQGDGNGQTVENWTGGNEIGDHDRTAKLDDVVSAFLACNNQRLAETGGFTGGDDDTNIAVRNIVTRFGDGPYTTASVCEAFPDANDSKTIECELAENADPNQTGSFTSEQLNAVASQTPFSTGNERTVDSVVLRVLAEFPEASRDQFFESDWLASSIAISSDPGNVGGMVSVVQLAGGGTRTEITGGVNTGCAFTAYDKVLSIVIETTSGGAIEFLEFPPSISDSVITDLPNGIHTLVNGSVITLDDGVVTDFAQQNQGPEVLDVFVLAERFRSCLMSSFDGVPTNVLSDGTPIGTVDEIADGIRLRAGIPADLIHEEEFLGNLPFGDLAAFCGQFAWNFISSLGEPPKFRSEILIDAFMEARGDGVQLSVDDFNVAAGEELTIEQWIEAVLNFDPIQFDRDIAIAVFMALPTNEPTADGQQLIGFLGLIDDGNLSGQVTSQEFVAWVAVADPGADAQEVNQIFRIFSETLSANDLAVELGSSLGEEVTAASLGFGDGQQVTRDEFVAGVVSLGNAEMDESSAADVFVEVFNTANPIE